MLQKHTRFTVEVGPRPAENGAGALRRREVIVKTTQIKNKNEKAEKNEIILEQLSGITVKTTTKKVRPQIRGGGDFIYKEEWLSCR